MAEEPEEKAQADRQEKASHDGEVKGGVLAAMDDIAGQAAEAKRHPGAEKEERASEGEHSTEDEENAAEFAERIHERRVSSGADAAVVDASDRQVASVRTER